MGTVSTAAKEVISGLKAIPEVNLAAGVINAVIAGSFVAAVGEGTIYAFEQVYLGKKTVSDIDKKNENLNHEKEHKAKKM